MVNSRSLLSFRKVIFSAHVNWCVFGVLSIISSGSSWPTSMPVGCEFCVVLTGCSMGLVVELFVSAFLIERFFVTLSEVSHSTILLTIDMRDTILILRSYMFFFKILSQCLIKVFIGLGYSSGNVVSQVVFWEVGFVGQCVNHD